MLIKRSMIWAGLIWVLVIFSVIIFTYVRQFYRQIVDPTWSAAKHLDAPPWKNFFFGSVGLIIRGFALIFTLLTVATILIGALLIGAWAHAVTQLEPGEVQYEFISELDAKFTRDFYPFYKKVLYPTLNLTVHLSEVVIPLSNLWSGAVHIVNKETDNVIWNCEYADIGEATLSLIKVWALLMQSLLDFVTGLFFADPQLMDLATPISEIQAAWGHLDGVLICACEILKPGFELIASLTTSNGLALFLDGSIQILTWIAPMLDFYVWIIDILGRIIEVFLATILNPLSFPDQVEESFRLDLTREPKFIFTATAFERLVLGLWQTLGDVVVGGFRAFWETFGSDLPDVISPVGHLSAAMVHLVRLFVDIVFHVGVALRGLYSGHIQAGIDPVANHFIAAADGWRNASQNANSVFGRSAICMFAGTVDGIFGSLEVFVRMIIGLVRSGRVPPLDYAVRYDSDNATRYAAFLNGPIIRTPLLRARLGWMEAGDCLGDFLQELDPSTADAWYEILHVVNATSQAIMSLVDNVPIYDGTDGYFNTVNGTKEFQARVQAVFNETKYMARAFGNFWSSRVLASETDYTQTEHGVDSTSATRTGEFPAEGTYVDYANRTRVDGITGTATYTRTRIKNFLGYKSSTISFIESFVGGANTTQWQTRTQVGTGESLVQKTAAWQYTATHTVSTTTIQSYLGTRSFAAQPSYIGSEAYYTTQSVTQTNAYPVCPSYTPPHDVYYGDSIFMPYPQGGQPYGFCCFGRFVERVTRLIIAILEILVDTGIHIAAKEFEGDTVMKSIATIFCPNGSGDLMREFIPLLTVTLDDLGCTLVGILRGLWSLTGADQIDLMCNNNPQDYLYTRIVKLISGYAFFWVELVGRLIAFMLKVMSMLMSSFPSTSGAPGSCPFGMGLPVFVDICSAHLVDPLGVSTLCDLIGNLYDFTVGAIIQLVLDLVDVIFCALPGGGAKIKGVRAFIAYLGPGGGFKDILCRILNLFGTIITLIRMIFNKDFVTLPVFGQDVDSPGVLNYIWCKLTNWFPFLNILADIVAYFKGLIDTIKCFIDAFKTIWGKLWNCITSCVTVRCWKKNPKQNLCCECNNIFGEFLDCKLPSITLFDKRESSEILMFQDCEVYDNATVLGKEAKLNCIWSETLAGVLDIMLLNAEFPEVRLVPPKSFYSVMELMGFAIRVGRVVPVILSEALQFMFSDADPFDLRVGNCSSMNYTESEALELSLCQFGVGFVRMLREMAAQGDITILGTVVNVIGEIMHMNEPFDLDSHLFAKSLNTSERRSVAWQNRLAYLDAHRAVVEIKRMSPPLEPQMKKKRINGEDPFIAWTKTTVSEMYGLGRRKSFDWEVVWNYFHHAVETKKRVLQEKTLAIPNVSLPQNLLCTGVTQPEQILNLRCTQRRPMWDAVGQNIGDCLEVPKLVWKIPSCEANFSGAGQAYCCGPSATCVATTNCSEENRIYGNCNTALCATLQDPAKGACCFEGNCTMTTALRCVGTFAGNGTTCAQSNLPLACESCRQQSCRRCALIINVIDELLDLIIEIGVDYWNLFEGAIPGRTPRNFTNVALPEPDDSPPPKDTFYQMFVNWFQNIYNLIVRLVNYLFGTKLAIIDMDLTRRTARSFFRGTGENSFSDWISVFSSCNVHEHVSCSRGKRGTGIKVAIIFVTTVMAVGLYFVKRIDSIGLSSVLGSFLIVIWFVAVFCIAFAISPWCIFKFGPPFIGGPSLFHIIPLLNLPIIPDCAPTELTESLLQPLIKQCWDKCEVACPWPSPNYYPCSWTLPEDLAPIGMIPGVNCNPNISNCCDVLPEGCPLATHGFQRLYPQCARAPFNIQGGTRELLLNLRLRTPSLFCILKSSAGFSITNKEDWDFAPGGDDCSWTTFDEAKAPFDERWHYCASNFTNLALLSHFFMVGLLILLVALPVGYSLFLLFSSALTILQLYVSRLTASLSRVVGFGSTESRSIWFRPYEVLGYKLKHKKAKKE